MIILETILTALALIFIMYLILRAMKWSSNQDKRFSKALRRNDEFKSRKP